MEKEPSDVPSSIKINSKSYSESFAKSSNRFVVCWDYYGD